ncbi:MAG: hypothetical protein ACUVRZ_12560 [Desulfobacca sp.]|uniref:hypothetical protein n=1 Tax=Desulfobacca sp. TaxID=2067990 RepID=UPI00404B147C
MGWSEDLLPYRAEDNFRGAALVAQDKNLLRLAATWPLVEKNSPEPPAPGEDVNLEGIWRKTRVNFEHWAELAQLNLLVVMEGFRALKGNRLILPDGSLNHLVDTLLQKEAAGQFMAKMGLKAGDLK